MPVTSMSELGQRIGNVSEYADLIGPDDIFRHNDLLVMPDDTVPLFEAMNEALKSSGREERYRVIGKEDLDEIRWEGIMTPKKAIEVIDSKGIGAATQECQPRKTIILNIVAPEVVRAFENTGLFKLNPKGKDNLKTYKVRMPTKFGFRPYSVSAEVVPTTGETTVLLYLYIGYNLFSKIISAIRYVALES